MARKILQVTIKTIDEKGHVRIWNESEVNVDTITFKGDKPVSKESPKEKKREIVQTIKQKISKKK